MKISILTFSKETNFGANLQCYALCKTLQGMGHKVDIIDIQLKRYSMSWYSAIMRLPMVWLFRQFRKQYLNVFTRHFSNVNELRRNYPKSDLYIVGSDQVWNPAITKRLDPLTYFFSFLPGEARRISYAASFGTGTWNFPNLTSQVKELIHQFDAVSVREESGVKICNEVFNTKATLVTDPTLLLSSYDDICGKYDAGHETNDLTYYTFVHNAPIQEVLVDFAKSQNLDAVVLRSNRTYTGFKLKRYVTVSEWLNSIRYSKIVVTDSFHCMVFCILFHKQFVAIPIKGGRATRQENLLELLGLRDHFCKETSDLYRTMEHVIHKDLDYAVIDQKIKMMREESLDFLRECCSERVTIK